MTQPTPQPDLLPLVLRVPEVCTLLDISEDTARRRIAAEVKPFHHAYLEGQTYRVPVADVVDYLQARHVRVPKSLLNAAAA